MEPTLLKNNDPRSFLLVEDEDASSTLRPYRTKVSTDLEIDPTRERVGLDCMDGWLFQVVVGLIILGNLGVTLYEAWHPECHSWCSIVDEVILGFYTAELLLNMYRYGCPGFFQTPKERWWHILDTAIVSFGIVELCANLEANSLVIGALRCLRLLRVFRLMRFWNDMNFVWTEADWFQWTAGSVIALNTVVLGFETDYPSPLWWWPNQAMLCFFVFEIAVRIKTDGCRNFFCSLEEELFWNWTDFVIVLFGVIDLWALRVAELFFGEFKGHRFGQLLMLVRMLRMLRILRLLKLVKAVRPLYSLALGVTQAMQSIIWVLILLVVTLYVFAILATRLIGHSKTIQDDEDLPLATRKLFSSMCDSLFGLFSVMNQQNWDSVAPLLEKMPSIKPVYVIFTICSSWALLSVLTGVVSDNMMSVREAQAQKDDDAQEEKREWLTRWLRGVFAAADKDGSGALGRSEYRELLRSPFHLKKLQHVARVPMQDMVQMFDLLDIDGNNQIEFNEFLIGFEWLNNPITGKSLLKVGHEGRISCMALEKLLVNLRDDLEETMRRQEDRQEHIEAKLSKVLQARKLLREEAGKAKMARDKVYDLYRQLTTLTSQLQELNVQDQTVDLPLYLDEDSPPSHPGRSGAPPETHGRRNVQELTTKPNWMRAEVEERVPDVIIQTPLDSSEDEMPFNPNEPPPQLTTKPNWLR
mmetsp:Transcript_37480/g.67794  ORF Transcript_37480/g.67794 Transcript_37480/m.67794 type:complete len:697 (+) Transcript_37480:82-2172(+)